MIKGTGPHSMTPGVRILCALAFTATSTAQAQSTWATISGRIVDSSRAAVPGAHVRAFSPDLSDPAETDTTSSGDFSLTFLPAGTYQLEITATGFKPSTKNEVPVKASESVEVTITLDVE